MTFEANLPSQSSRLSHGRKSPRKAVAQIHQSALGGYTIEGPFHRRPSRVAYALDRFFYWLGA